MRFFRLALRLCLLLAPAVAGCRGDSFAPTTQSPNIYFHPPPGEVEIEPFAQLLFESEHRSGEEPTARYYLDGELVHTGSDYLYSSSYPGEHVVRVDASVGNERRSAGWTVHVVDEVSSAPPMALDFNLARSPIPGAVEAAWERPPTSQSRVPVERYLLHYGYEAFLELPHPGVATVEISPDPSQILQRTILSGLSEGAVLYARVQVRDVLGRLSSLSAWDSEDVTASFQIEGRSWAFETSTLSWSPLAETGVRWRNHSTVADNDGSYLLAGLSSYYMAELSASHPSGRHHDLRTLTLLSVDRRQELHFLPLQSYSMRGSDGELEDVDLSRLLRIFSRTETGTTSKPKSIHHWESYPVRIHLPDFVHEGDGGESVDYASIFRGAMERWNLAAGETMFEEAAEATGPGASYSASLAGPNVPLGNVVIVDPPNGSLLEAPPRRMLVELREFNTVDVAERVITHELGHVLLLGHSPDPTHCMNAGVPTVTPTELEGRVTRLLAAMPQGLDMNLYRED